MIILLYSNQDREFAERIESIKKNYELLRLLSPVCIDSNDIYNIITTSTNIEITEVPCVLDVADDNMSMFEGLKKTNEYIDELLEHIQKEKPESPKVTNLSLLGLFDEEEEEEEKKPIPGTKTSTKTSMTDKAAEMQSAREAFKITSTPSADSSRRTPVKITSAK
jgi:hypothetical protein